MNLSYLFKANNCNFLIGILLFICVSLSAQNTVINGPTGSGRFGSNITVLPNGNYVVIDPLFDNSVTDIGAVYLYNGKTHALISTLIGSTTNDQIGINGITVLPNGNYVITSTGWDNGSNVNAGAVTWCSATTGCSGVVSASNSLVGSSNSDQIGNNGIFVLSNGNYIVRTNNWDNGAVVNAGAVTWCNANTGLVGALSASNSLVGSSANDQVGSAGIGVLPNGHYIVNSPNWDNGAVANVGAVTWCNGTTGLSGIINSTNSLVGSTTNDLVGNFGLMILNNGNYLVKSISWDRGSIVDAGAVTWCNGSIGRVGAVSSSNSLVGSTDNDNVGNSSYLLSNGNYVVVSTNWHNLSVSSAGAITWCDGATGLTGPVTPSNSLVGSSNSDQIGSYGILVLKNGNYVVNSPYWDNGATADVGAITWCDGTTGKVGVINSSNSLLGVKANDQIGSGGITTFNNGNYTVQSPYWDNGAITDAGAVTWCNGAIGRVGTVGSTNSLVGSSIDDFVGSSMVTVLSNGNYVVRSINWNNGAITKAGAVTWCDGNSGRVGVVSSSNSLVGSSIDDQVGATGIVALNNGNYVVGSYVWNNGAMVDAGAVTWCDGSIGRVGTINSSNSLVGSSANDIIGNGGIAILKNSNYIVMSSYWDIGAIANVGAVTFGNGSTGVAGVISSSNSLIGSSINDNIGSGNIKILNNGNYIVISPNWDNGPMLNVGALTMCNGNSGKVGVVAANNSFIGSTANDFIGVNFINELSNGYLLFVSSNWDNGTLVNGTATSIIHGNSDLIGTINTCNSVLGLVANPTYQMSFAHDTVYNYMLVGKPSENKLVVRKFDNGSSFSQTTCSNQPIVWNGVSLNTSGAYKDTFPSLLGCDSVVTLNLTVTPAPSNATSTTNKTIFATEVGATYQWINCANNTPISGATNASYTPDQDGSYKVVVTKSNCVDTSVCTTISGVRILDIDASSMGTIYPNPADREVQIILHSNSKLNHIRLFTLDGKEILVEQFQGNQHRIEVERILPGFYMYELEQDGKKEKGKLNIQH